MGVVFLIVIIVIGNGEREHIGRGFQWCREEN